MNDLISREAAIAAMAEAYEDTDAEHILRKIPSAQQWIPVSERLPEHQQEVVIKTMNGVTEVMRFCNCYFERFGMDESIDWYAQNEVEVWMPLPEPYRGGTK